MKNINKQTKELTFLMLILVSFIYLTGCGKRETTGNVEKKNQQTEMKPQDKPKDTVIQKTEQPLSTDDKTKKETTNEKTVLIDLSTDMICETSMPIIKDALMKVNGVKSVKINEDTKNAKVVYDASLTNVKLLEKAVIQTGFDANGKEGDAAAYQKLPSCCKIK